MSLGIDFPRQREEMVYNERERKRGRGSGGRLVQMAHNLAPSIGTKNAWQLTEPKCLLGG